MAESGEQGVELLGEDPGRVSCVFLDLTLPGIDGVQCLAPMRRVRPDLPVVLCSGFSQSELSEKYQDSGFSGFVQKPFSIKTVRRIIEEAGLER